MITIIQSNGTIVKTQPDRVYQGSNKVNQIVLVGAFAQNLIPQISFKLPQSADYTPFDYFTPTNIPTDEGISAWTYDIPITVTQEYGNVKFQIKAEDSEGNVVASGQCSFEVERGTPPDISDIPDLEPLETIKQILQDIYAIYENGDLLSKGVFPYDETFNYPEGATVFDRESEQFYMSLVNNNIGNAVSDSAKWRRVASFMLYGGTFDGSGVITASEYVPELDGTNITTIDLDKYISRYFKCAEPFDFSGESYLIDDIALCNGNISPSWTKFNNNGHVISVNRKTGIVVLSASDVGATTVSTIISRNQSLPASEASPDFVQNGSELLYKSAQNNSSGGVSYTYTTTKGDKGDAATIQVGTVTTGEAGTQASVTNIGTANAAVFDFTIPKGDKGDKGEAGETNSLSIGTVTTGEAGTQASATITGTAPNQILNLTIPKGDIGATGEQGPQGPEGLQYLTVSRVFNSRYPVGTVAPYYLNDFNRTPVVNDIFSTLCANQYYTTFKIINAETRQMQSITEVNIQGPQGIEYLTTNRNFTNEYNIGDTTSINNNEFNRTPVVNDIFSTLCANKYYTTFKVLSVSDTSCSCQVIAKVNLQGAAGADGADGVQDNELISRETLPTASADSPDFVQTDDGLVYKKSTTSEGGTTYSYEEVRSGGGNESINSTCLFKLGKMGARKITPGSRWINKKWNGFADIHGRDIWSDGNNIYCSDGGETKQYVLDTETSTWTPKTWSGLTNVYFLGEYVWSDGKNIYYSNPNTSGSPQYVLDTETSTWTPKTWNGFTNIDGKFIWSDGNNIYYSKTVTYPGQHYVLDIETSTWTQKTWNGCPDLNGEYVWSDGNNIYYSQGTAHYVLDIETSTWTQKTWNGETTFYGSMIWSDGNNIYFSNGTAHYVLDIETSTWTQKTWNGLDNITGIGFSGVNVWSDGNNIYFSNGTASNNRSLITNIDTTKLM